MSFVRGMTAMIEIEEMTGPLWAFLGDRGHDSRNRSVRDILLLSNDDLERVHDYIQWLFPLPSRSLAQPDAPVLSEREIAAIRNDPACQQHLREAAERMARFYETNRSWLVRNDHNHLRITRIVRSLHILVDDDAARGFLQRILALHQAAGEPVHPTNVGYWRDALND